jgi:hypothetical protein
LSLLIRDFTNATFSASAPERRFGAAIAATVFRVFHSSHLARQTRTREPSRQRG